MESIQGAERSHDCAPSVEAYQKEKMTSTKEKVKNKIKIKNKKLTWRVIKAPSGPKRLCATCGEKMTSTKEKVKNKIK